MSWLIGKPLPEMKTMALSQARMAVSSSLLTTIWKGSSPTLHIRRTALSLTHMKLRQLMSRFHQKLFPTRVVQAIIISILQQSCIHTLQILHRRQKKKLYLLQVEKMEETLTGNLTTKLTTLIMV